MRFPRLSVRDLFWLVLVCAMALGWFVDRSVQRYNAHRLAQLERLANLLETSGCQIILDENGTSTATGVTWPKVINDRDARIAELEVEVRRLQARLEP